MANQPKCVKCGDEMQEGFILDRGHGNVPKVGEGLRGTPE